MGRFGSLIAAAILGWMVAPASADTIANFTFDNVTFSDGGSASGSFTLDLTTALLSNVDVTTTNGTGFVSTVSGATYQFGGFGNGPASFDFFILLGLSEDQFIVNLSTTLTPSDLVCRSRRRWLARPYRYSMRSNGNASAARSRNRQRCRRRLHRLGGEPPT
jgi:hypothetical protein